MIKKIKIKTTTLNVSVSSKRAFGNDGIIYILRKPMDYKKLLELMSFAIQAIKSIYKNLLILEKAIIN